MFFVSLFFYIYKIKALFDVEEAMKIDSVCKTQFSALLGVNSFLRVCVESWIFHSLSPFRLCSRTNVYIHKMAEMWKYFFSSINAFFLIVQLNSFNEFCTSINLAFSLHSKIDLLFFLLKLNYMNDLIRQFQWHILSSLQLLSLIWF